MAVPMPQVQNPYAQQVAPVMANPNGTEMIGHPAQTAQFPNAADSTNMPFAMPGYGAVPQMNIGQTGFAPQQAPVQQPQAPQFNPGLPQFPNLQSLPAYGQPQPGQTAQPQTPQQVPQLPTGFQSWDQVFQQLAQPKQEANPMQLMEAQLKVMQERDKAWESKFEKLIEASSRTKSNEADYLNMPSDDLLDLINDKGQLPNILASIAKQAKQQALDEAKNTLGTEVESLKNTQTAIMKEFLGLMATAQLQTIKSRYASDPELDKNLSAAGQWLRSPAGEAYAAKDPQNALEFAYKQVIVDRMFNPQYQQQMGNAAMQAAMAQMGLKMQGGGAQPNMQHTQPMQQFGPMTTQPTDDSYSTLAKVLSFSNNLGFPNVRVVT